MVSRETIEYILEKTITCKCGYTIAEMKEMLSGMSQRDKSSALGKSNLVNQMEAIHYHDLYFEHESTLMRMEKLDKDSEEYKDAENYLKEINDEMFYYERRIIEGLPPQKPAPLVDKGKYKTDTQWDDVYEKEGNLKTRMGDLEQKQINAQSNIFSKDTDTITTNDKGVSITKFDSIWDERMAMNCYFAGDSSHLNRDIYNKQYLSELSKAQQRHVKNIDKLMDASPGLLEDTVLYRKGNFNFNLRVGDHDKFKGYTSTTFQEAVADEFYGGSYDSMMFVIHAPKGTKGICGNDNRNFKNGFMEHEYCLPRNTGYTVMDIDWSNGVVEIVLDE